MSRWQKTENGWEKSEAPLPEQKKPEAPKNVGKVHFWLHFVLYFLFIIIISVVVVGGVFSAV